MGAMWKGEWDLSGQAWVEDLRGKNRRHGPRQGLASVSGCSLGEATWVSVLRAPGLSQHLRRHRPRDVLLLP